MTTITPGVQRIPLATGRKLGINTLHTGSSGKVVVLCHPSPGSGLIDPDPVATADADITLIAVDRPGYGASDAIGPNEWATVADRADDIAFALGEMGIDQVDVAGWSAGGWTALALAARYPALVGRVVLQGTPAPHEEIPWIDPAQYDGLMQLSDMQVNDIRTILTTMFEDQSDGMPPDDVLMALLGASVADEGVLAQPGARDRVVAMLRHAFDQGVTGMVDDIIGPNLKSWGFHLDDVKVSVLLQYGDEDEIAGYAHGKWWHSHLPEARLDMIADVGHMVALAGWKRALGYLAA